ncbi:type III secretion system apparatus protein [Candidatus Regiella insecticola LSR1]|uniref:Type III secretion system apparatus protein n=1 Tax=Candidatus Regiella insecticola LSR1 TaxID=663321 RepID=E0WTJ4_9ENTR|nr:TyeA family type III secretion system gatekeeper subunit [Candidatus Regiella insecticola]EFL91879.1 type III secretion system apparatus protein [Candidatus Regiella insecticola LSR1]
MTTQPINPAHNPPHSIGSSYSGGALGTVVQPPTSAMKEAAEAALSLQDTQEDIAFLFSAKVQDDQQAKKIRRDACRQREFLKIIEHMAGHSEGKNLLSSPLPNQDSEFARAAKMLQIGGFLRQHWNNPARRKTASQELSELMEEAGWEVELFGLLEFGSLNGDSLRAVKHLFQQSIDEEEKQSLDKWFKRVSHWKNRKPKVLVLLRALAFDMSTQPTTKRGHRLAAILGQLRRLLLFLGLEDHCKHVGDACGLEGDIVLQEVLAIVGQPWLFKECLQRRLANLQHLSPQQQPIFLLRLNELFKLMPAAHFNDDEQREQILEILQNFYS